MEKKHRILRPFGRSVWKNQSPEDVVKGAQGKEGRSEASDKFGGRDESQLQGKVAPAGAIIF